MTQIPVIPPDLRDKTTVYAADFGFSPANEDNAPALARAIEHCRETDAGILRLAPGVYRIKNTDFLTIRDRENFALDGCGAELISETSYFFMVQNCRQVLLENLTLDVDWNILRPASLARVISREDFDLELEFLDDDHPSLDFDICSFNPFDPIWLTPGVPGDPEIWVHPEEFSVLGRGEADNRIRLRCTAKGVETMRPGAFYLVRHLRQRRGAAFFVQDSRHITLQNNCVYSTWGMTHMVNGQSSHILFDGEIIRIRPGSRRHISTDGDGIHIIRSQGYLQIQNCDFSGMGDDDVNIHDCNMLILRRLGSHTLLLENEGAGDPGDRLELLNKDFSPSGVSLTLRAVTQQEDGRYCLEIEEELPDWIEEGHLLLNRHYASDHFVIRNNYFHDHRARGLLLQTKEGLVENNLFRRTQGAGIYIMLETLRGLWYEGTGAGQLVIRNNRLEECNCGGWTTAVDMMATLPDNTSGYTPFSDIRLENNTIRVTQLPAAWLGCCDGVTFTGNALEAPPTEEMPAVVCERCRNENLSGNLFCGVPLAVDAVRRTQDVRERNRLQQYSDFVY